MVTQAGVSPARGGWRRAAVCGGAGVALVVLSSSRWGSVAGPDPAGASPPSAAVVVAAADIPAGAVVDSSMLASASVPAPAAPGLVRDGATLAGRVLLVPVLKGEPLGFGMTSAHPAAGAGHRLIRVSLQSVDVAPDVGVGAQADLVASFPPTASDQKATVTVVATARVAALERQPDGQGLQASPDANPAGTGTNLVGSTTAVTLDCVAAEALRVLWARDNARVLRLLAHPAGDPSLPAATAPA